MSDPHIGSDSIGTIGLHICSLAQMFDVLDPAPLRERALEPNAETYILACAETYRPTAPLRMLLHLPESLRVHATDATNAVHGHFRRTHAQGERDFRRRIRIGGFIFAVALAALAVSVVLRSLLSSVEERLLVQGLDEGLLILGWVMMWRPIDILLFEHWESHLDHARLKRLASIPIEFVFHPDGDRQQ